MDNSSICIHCLRDKGNGKDICPHCGFDERTYDVVPYALLPRTTLNDRYLLGIVLGSGGFGITYLAWDTTLDRRVAIKEYFVRGIMYRSGTESCNITTTGVSASEEHIFQANLKRFESEAKTLANLEHFPGIVRVYDFFKENSTVYMVLEYLPGKTLEQYVKDQGGTLPFSHVVNLLTPIMNSLSKLHRKGILHRDISPDNMMISMGDDDGLKVTLFDFGGAKQLSGDGKSSSIALKKMGYTPIEQIGYSNSQGPWTDEYAMAATIYYCICGEPPADSTVRINNPEELKLPSKLGVKIPSKMEAVLLKGMAERSKDRYATLEDFCRALHGETVEDDNNRTIPVIPGGGERYLPENRPSSGGKKGKTIAAVIAGAILLGGGGYYYFSQKEPARSDQTQDNADDKREVRGNNLISEATNTDYSEVVTEVTTEISYETDDIKTEVATDIEMEGETEGIIELTEEAIAETIEDSEEISEISAVPYDYIEEATEESVTELTEETVSEVAGEAIEEEIATEAVEEPMTRAAEEPVKEASDQEALTEIAEETKEVNLTAVTEETEEETVIEAVEETIGEIETEAAVIEEVAEEVVTEGVTEAIEEVVTEEAEEIGEMETASETHDWRELEFTRITEVETENLHWIEIESGDPEEELTGIAVLSEKDSEEITEAMSDLIREPITEVEREITAEVVSEVETGIVTEAVSEVETETTTEAISEVETEITTEFISEAEIEIATEAISEVETEITTEAVSEVQTEIATGFESDTEIEVAVEVETESVIEAEIEIATEQETETKPEIATEKAEEVIPEDDTHGTYVVISEEAYMVTNPGNDNEDTRVRIPKYALTYIYSTEDDGVWRKASYGTHMGWISRAYLELVTEDNVSLRPNRSCFVNVKPGETLAIKAAFDDSADEVARAAYGEEATIITVNQDWAKIHMTDTNTEGWVHLTDIQTYIDDIYYYVSSGSLNIRSEPRTDSNAVGKYYIGNTVKIIEESDGWGKTDKGWIAMKYMVPCKEADGGAQYETEAYVPPAAPSAPSYTPSYTPAPAPSGNGGDSGGVIISGF